MLKPSVAGALMLAMGAAGAGGLALKQQRQIRTDEQTIENQQKDINSLRSEVTH